MIWWYNDAFAHKWELWLTESKKWVRPKIQLDVNPRFHFVVKPAWRLAVGSWQQVCKLLFSAFHLCLWELLSGAIIWLSCHRCSLHWRTMIYGACGHQSNRKHQLRRGRHALPDSKEQDILPVLSFLGQHCGSNQSKRKKMYIGINAQHLKKWVADDVCMFVWW